MYTASFHTISNHNSIKFPIIHQQSIDDLGILREIVSDQFSYSTVYIPEVGKQGYFANHHTSAIEFADVLRKFKDMPLYWISDNAILIDGIELNENEEKVLMSLWKILPDNQKSIFLSKMKTTCIENIRFFRAKDGKIFATYTKRISRTKTLYANWVPIIF